MAQPDDTVVIEGAELAFLNFTGKEGMYNRQGNREFSIILPDQLAQEMLEDGWNVKSLRAREEGDDPRHYITVSVGYNARPPRIVMITSRGKTDLGEDECEILDSVDIQNVDVIIRPYKWEVNDKSGIKAYLKSIYVTINEDPLELKYAELDQA